VTTQVITQLLVLETKQQHHMRE